MIPVHHALNDFIHDLSKISDFCATQSQNDSNFLYESPIEVMQEFLNKNREKIDLYGIPSLKASGIVLYRKSEQIHEAFKFRDYSPVSFQVQAKINPCKTLKDLFKLPSARP